MFTNAHIDAYNSIKKTERFIFNLLPFLNLQVTQCLSTHF